MAEQVHYEEGVVYYKVKSMESNFRATAKLHDRRVSMYHVPPEYAVLPDGTAFLQHSTPEVQVYYSIPTIEVLYALVGDGVHDMQPDATNKLGQLYTIQGVLTIRTGDDVPLLYAVIRRKNRRTHETLFEMLRDAITALEERQGFGSLWILKEQLLMRRKAEENHPKESI
ncbi:hypothetical protein OSTOST_12171 [Ostertagia ostertagi]